MVRLLVAPRAISLLGENAFVADKLVEVEPELLDAFLGGRRGDAAGAALLPGDASRAASAPTCRSMCGSARCPGEGLRFRALRNVSLTGFDKAVPVHAAEWAEESSAG